MRTLKELISNAFAALGFAIIATLAFSATPAAAVTCVSYNPGHAWPNGPYTQTCGVPATEGQYLASALNGVPGFQSRNLLQVKMTNLYAANPKHGVFYLFHDAAAFMTWAATNLPASERPANISELDGALGFTRVETVANQKPLYTVMFEHVDTWGTNGDLPLNVVQSAAAHESGHWLDSLLSFLKPQISGLEPLLSNTQWFRNLAHADYLAIDALPNKCLANNKGLFNVYQYRDINGTGVKKYFCDTAPGGSPGSGSNLLPPFNTMTFSNSGILSIAWPGIFNSTTNIGRQNELFAEGFAIGVLSNTDNSLPWFPASLYVYWRGFNQAYPSANLFKCTTAFLTYVYQFEALPPAGSLPTGCPTS